MNRSMVFVGEYTRIAEVALCESQALLSNDRIFWLNVAVLVWQFVL